MGPPADLSLRRRTGHTENPATIRRAAADARPRPRPTVLQMKGTAAVLWTLHGNVHSGRLEAMPDRLELTARGIAFSIPVASIREFGIERGPADRIRGLAVLTLSLVEGDVVRIASLQGTGVLHELAGSSRPPSRPPSGERIPQRHLSGDRRARRSDDSTSSVPPTSASRSRIPSRPSASSRTSVDVEPAAVVLDRRRRRCPSRLEITMLTCSRRHA